MILWPGWPPPKVVTTGIYCLIAAYWSDTPGHRTTVRRIYTLRGGASQAKGSEIPNRSLPYWGSCWHYFSLLGASWPHFATLAAFVVALGRFWWAPGRSGLDFGGSRAGPGKVWEALRPYFSMLFRACNLAMRNQPERRFVLEKPIRN